MNHHAEIHLLMRPRPQLWEKLPSLGTLRLRTTREARSRKREKGNLKRSPPIRIQTSKGLIKGNSRSRPINLAGSYPQPFGFKQQVAVMAQWRNKLKPEKTRPRRKETLLKEVEGTPKQLSLPMHQIYIKCVCRPEIKSRAWLDALVGKIRGLKKQETVLMLLPH